MAKQNKVNRLVIEAVANGFRVLIPHKSSKLTASDISAASLQMLYDNLQPHYEFNTINIRKPKKFADKAKKPEAPPTPAPYGEYVFADYASLNAFLKTYLKHAKGIEQ